MIQEEGNIQLNNFREDVLLSLTSEGYNIITMSYDIVCYGVVLLIHV